MLLFMVLKLATALCLFGCLHVAFGVSTPEVFEYTLADDSASSGIQLVDRATHNINKRDTADPTSEPPVIFHEDHDYYNRTVAIDHPLSSFYSSEFDRVFATYPSHTDVRLNNGKNLALSVPLTFVFDFYGHPVQTMVVTNSGFLYANKISHPYLGFSQYIAPLMADFEASSSVSSVIKYVETAGAFWVRWENMLLSSNLSVGNFSFQCVLFSNGSIVFDYISIPISMDELKALSSSLKIGLSDAFYYDYLVPGVGLVRKIVKYHEVKIPLDHVVTDGVIHFAHLPTCHQQTSCRDCTNKGRVPNFNCSWCYEMNRCSSGVDRQLQMWYNNDCHFLSGGKCDRRPPPGGRIVLGVCLGLLLLAGVAALIGALVYGYRHPNSRLGACLLECRAGRLRERLSTVRFSRGGGGDGAGGGGDRYKIGDENPYVNFSNT